MRKLVFAFVVLLFAASFVFAADPRADLKKADQSWEKAAEAKNLDHFMSFVGDDIAECGPDGKWVNGKNATRDLFSKMFADSSFKLAWTMESAEVSKDGDFGYTRGTFQASQAGKPMSGAYATVWKKNSAGKWQVVVDIASAASQP